MNAKEFENKVALMRKAQKEYFKTRDRMWLEDSKRMEREIDAELESRRNPDTQQMMFDQGGDGTQDTEAPKVPYLHFDGYQNDPQQLCFDTYVWIDEFEQLHIKVVHNGHGTMTGKRTLVNCSNYGKEQTDMFRKFMNGELKREDEQ